MLIIVLVGSRLFMGLNCNLVSVQVSARCQHVSLFFFPLVPVKQMDELQVIVGFVHAAKRMKTAGKLSREK